MKKLMFSALACVSFAFSGFASNEVVTENQIEYNTIEKEDLAKIKDGEFAIEPCSITINIRNEKGEIVRTKKYPKVDYRPFKSCKEAGEYLAKKLEGVVVNS